MTDEARTVFFSFGSKISAHHVSLITPGVSAASRLLCVLQQCSIAKESLITFMTTRRATKKQRIETGPLLGPVHLPSEVLIGNNLLRCLDLRSLLLLSTCNSAFQREVFRKQIGEDEDTVSIWQTIDFGSVPSEMAAQLTDEQLQKLLIKCHAKEVTTILKLTGCVGLKGAGLEPLRGSIVLREADPVSYTHLTLPTKA